MTDTDTHPSSGSDDLAALPSAVLAQWRAENDSRPAASSDPAEILAARDERLQRLAAIDTFMAIDRMTGMKYAKGIRYLFAMHVDGQSADDIAQHENTTAEKIHKAAKDACAALRPALAPFIAKP